MVRRSAAAPAVPPLDLAAHRQRSGVSLEEVADRTKISKRFLLAIECGRYDELPGGIFTISYLKQYAQQVGYETRLLLDHYAQSLERPVESRPVRSDSGWRSLTRRFQIG
jgi:cytoskeletal protein RodZ